MNTIEIDCVSKSTIRTALNEVLLSQNILLDKKVFYLPSYEIVRWIAPVATVPIFVVEDRSAKMTYTFSAWRTPFVCEPSGVD